MHKTITHEHNHTQSYAFKKLSKFILQLQKQYKENVSDPWWEWNDEKDQMEFSLGIGGYYISGNLFLFDHKVEIEAEVPIVAALRWGKIESMIRSKLYELLK